MAGTTRPQCDLVALDRLYRSEYESSVRLARLLTSDHHVAEELAQEAFVRVAPRLRSADNPAAYLRTIVVNLCRDHGRRQSTARRHPVDEPEVVTAPPLPDDVTEIWQAVQALPPARREALILRYWADLPTAEVARLLDTRPSTARSLIRRGLASLKEVLSDES